MKYFTKYLPVEGKIELGYKKVKLFLCSNDIQVGDVIYNLPPFNSKYEKENEFTGYLWTDSIDFSEIPTISGEDITGYKIIGEISKSAIWVKDGQEFEEEEFQAAKTIEKDENAPFETTKFTISGKEIVKDSCIEGWKIEIKCPTCGTFH